VCVNLQNLNEMKVCNMTGNKQTEKIQPKEFLFIFCLMLNILYAIILIMATPKILISTYTNRII